MLIRNNTGKYLILAAIACTVAVILLWNARKTSIEKQKNGSSEEVKQLPASELQSNDPVYLLWNKDMKTTEKEQKMLKMCPNYQEFRDVNFVKTAFRHTLCYKAEAYKLMSDGYPMCVLANPLNYDLVSIAKDNSETIDFQLVASNSAVKLFVFRGNEATSLIYKANHRYWESDEIQWLMRFALKFMPEVTFLDIGCNLGVYTMEAAKLGLPVVSLEANIRNAIRVHLSLHAARLQADMVWNFISQDHELKYMTFPTESCTQSFASGKVQLGMNDTVPIMPIGGDKLRSLIKTKYVVMKVDIDGGETDFLKTSTRLFSEFNVVAVQIEWAPFLVQDFETRHMMKFFNDRGYRPWRVPGFSGVGINNITSMGPINVLWVHKTFLHKM